MPMSLNFSMFQHTNLAVIEMLAYLTVDLLSSWKCGGSVENMPFDTTASNTGHMTAACVPIPQRFGRALLWSACAHHVVEVILSHVFDAMKIIEPSKSLEVTAFAKFRKHFQLLCSHRSASLHYSAEKEGKLRSDFLTLPKGEGHYRNGLQ